MRRFDDLDLFTPEQRLAKVGDILAAGILRLHTRSALSDDVAANSAAENSTDCAAPGLEVSDETVLSVHNG